MVRKKAPILVHEQLIGKPLLKEKNFLLWYFKEILTELRHFRLLIIKKINLYDKKNFSLRKITVSSKL